MTTGANDHTKEHPSHFCLDINECTDGTDRCSRNARCINTQGSHTCSCNLGFHGDGTSCSDIDECAEGVHDCHQKAECINTRGSYRCSCLNGYHGDGKQCKGKLVIHVHLRCPIECVHCHAIKK